MIQAAEDGANIEAATAQVVLGSKRFREGWVMPSSFIDPTIRDLLCKAIRQRCVVELRYEQDGLFRKFEPHALYYSTKDNMCVSGTQTQNLNKPTNGNEPRIFDLSDIREVRLTALAFTPDLRFDRSDPRYKNGIICSV